jgi:alanyl-tRNA synthetase
VDNPPAILLAASADVDLDAGKRLKDALASHGGRGGGNPRLAQGTVGDATSLSAVLDAILAG